MLSTYPSACIVSEFSLGHDAFISLGMQTKTDPGDKLCACYNKILMASRKIKNVMLKSSSCEGVIMSQSNRMLYLGF